MAVSKKMKIQREHKKADAAGTRAAVKPNGLPVKAPKEMTKCTNCFMDLIKANQAPLIQHAENRHPALTKEQCFPDVQFK